MNKKKTRMYYELEVHYIEIDQNTLFWSICWRDKVVHNNYYEPYEEYARDARR